MTTWILHDLVFGVHQGYDPGPFSDLPPCDDTVPAKPADYPLLAYLTPRGDEAPTARPTAPTYTPRAGGRRQPLTYRVNRPVAYTPPTPDQIHEDWKVLNAQPTRDNQAERLYVATWLDREQLVELALSYGGHKTPLSQTVLPFGPFSGLTFQQIIDLQVGQVVAQMASSWGVKATIVAPNLADFNDRLSNQKQRAKWGLPHWKLDCLAPVVVTSDTEGVRYLDRLLDVDRHHWLFPNTYARIALFLADRRVRLTRELAYTTCDGQGKNRREIGQRLDHLALATYGDHESLAPSDFLCVEEQVADRWGGQCRELLVRQSSRFAVDDDPTPEGWELVDSTRAARGRMTERDQWQDFKAPAFNDLDWGYVDGYEFTKPASQDRALTAQTFVTPFKVEATTRTYALPDHDGESMVIGIQPARKGWSMKPTKCIEVPVGRTAEPEVSAVKLTTTFSPHEEVASRRAWALGLQAIESLERVGGPAEQPLAIYERRVAEWEARRAEDRAEVERPCEWFDRWQMLVDGIKRDLGVAYTTEDGEAKFRWHPAVSKPLQAALNTAMGDALQRLDAAYLEQSRERKEAEENERQTRMARNVWRGLTPTGRKSRAKAGRYRRELALTS